MPQTFEELAAEQMDPLYRGALFLNAGNAAEAGDLLMRTLTGSFREYREWEQAERAPRWLESRLVRAYLDGAPSVGGDRTGGPEAHGFRVPSRPPSELFDPARLTSDALYRAARSVPASARAALWLVLLRRWSYADASETLGITIDELKDELRFGHALAYAVFRSAGGVVPGDRNGTDDGRAR